MTNIITGLANITPDGIFGMILIFAAIPLLLSASSWLIIKFTKSKSEPSNDKTSTPQVSRKELQT